MPETVTVALNDGRDYDIVIGAGLLGQLPEMLAARFKDRRVLVLCDENAQCHLPRGLNAHLRILTSGEGTKSFHEIENSVSWILDQRPDRKTLIAAMGGGVAGDHAGFAAAITLRGLDYIQIPTTLLAQVDSSVGGKTGINTPQGKNLIGAFHQPRLVVIDIDTLKTLPDRDMRAGYAEMVKYAFIGNRDFFEWLESNGVLVLNRDPDALVHAIATSCRAKATIVAEDEKESCRRALLNFGHTFAHALEAACGYDRRLLHGEAVAVGMALAFEASSRMGLINEDEGEGARAVAHMRRLGLPTRIADIHDFPNLSADELVTLMAHDKKASGGRLTFILSRGIGHAFVTQDVDMQTVRDVLQQSKGA